MVTQKTMTIDGFVLGARQTAQQQPLQGRGQTPPPSPPSQIGRTRKRQRVVEHTSTGPRDVVIRTPPQPSRGIVIQEPQTQVGVSVASSSQAAQAWQPKFSWTASHSLRALVYGCGRKVKGVVLPKVWCTAFFCPRMCTLLRRGRRSLWEEDFSGILLR